MTVPAHDTRQGDTLDVPRIPDCEVCKVSEDKKEPAEFLVKVSEGVWRYVCAADRVLFGPDRLGGGFGQKLRLRPGSNTAPKTEPWPDDSGVIEGQRFDPDTAKPPRASSTKREVRVPTIEEGKARAAELKAQAEATKPKLTGAAKKAAMNRKAADERLSPDAEVVEFPATDGPPEGHIQLPGTKWTPSDPQQQVATQNDNTQEDKTDG